MANLWLTFSIIIDLVPSGENPTYFFGTKEITHWVNLGLTWLYGATLAMQFILALGNRPKGEVYSYVASFVIFAVSSIFNHVSNSSQTPDFVERADPWLLSYCLRRLVDHQSILCEFICTTDLLDYVWWQMHLST